MSHADSRLGAVVRDLFADGVRLVPEAHGVVAGKARTKGGRDVAVVGITEGTALGIEAALAIAGRVLDHVEHGGEAPLVVLVDTQSQRMARRDELLGLNEFLAHLCKCLALCSLSGCRTVGLLYGAAAAGAFIATALSTDTLIALEGADPSVMDLPSIARVTKLELDRLKEMARSTAIFAPGIEHLAATGAVAESWTDRSRYGEQLDALLASGHEPRDQRDRLGAERRGRLQAAAIADAVREAARAAR